MTVPHFDSDEPPIKSMEAARDILSAYGFKEGAKILSDDIAAIRSKI